MDKYNLGKNGKFGDIDLSKIYTIVVVIVELLINILFFIVVLTVSLFLFWIIELFIDKARREMSPFDSGWSGGGD